MKRNIKTLNMDLTPAISAYLEKKIAHFDKFLTNENSENTICHVELGKTTQHHKNGDFFKTEISIRIAGKSFRAKAEESDLYASIDIATDDMIEELSSFKDKKVSLVRRSGAKIKSILKGLDWRK